MAASSSAVGSGAIVGESGTFAAIDMAKSLFGDIPQDQSWSKKYTRTFPPNQSINMEVPTEFCLPGLEDSMYLFNNLILEIRVRLLDEETGKPPEK